MAKNKNPLTDNQVLQVEKLRLKMVIAEKEQKLLNHFDELKSNSVNMVLHSVLPFEGDTNSKVIAGLHMITDNFLPTLFGVSFGKEKGAWKNNAVKLVQAMMIALSFTFFKKVLGKKKAELKSSTPDQA